MVKIAQLPQQLGTNFPIGDANHNSRDEIYGTSALPTDSLLIYEYEGNNQFQRVGTNTMVRGGPWWFGDGDNDGLMEVIGCPLGAAWLFGNRRRTTRSLLTVFGGHSPTQWEPIHFRGTPTSTGTVARNS